MVTGGELAAEGERLYGAGRQIEAFELYRRGVVQILDHEDIFQKIPGIPEQYPQELLAAIWQNLLGRFRSNGSGFTQEAYPDAYDLVYSFRPGSSSRTHPQFTGSQGQPLLKAMQISAAFTLATLAWDKRDRSTAAKRYQEGLDVAATHPPFNSVTPGLKHLDRRVAQEIEMMRENLAKLIHSDSINASQVGSGHGILRKEVLNMPHMRIEDDGTITRDDTFVVATDACGGCSRRGVNFKRCGTCMKIAYCSVECQKRDWKKHKATHI